MTKPRRPLSAAAFLLLCGGAFAFSLAEEPPPSEPDQTLVSSFEAIRQAFRTGQVSPMNPLLPPAGKVFLSVHVIAAEPGFYSRDQLEALLRQTFQSIQTLRFHINVDLYPDGGEERNVAVCPAVWSFKNKGVRGDVNLRFLLARQQGRWLLSEIRETH